FSLAASSAPRTNSGKKGLVIVGMSTPTVSLFWARRLLAIPLGRYWRRSIASKTRSRVGSEIPGFRLTTAETVWIETLATRATSVMVALRSELTWGDER